MTPAALVLLAGVASAGDDTLTYNGFNGVEIKAGSEDSKFTGSVVATSRKGVRLNVELAGKLDDGTAQLLAGTRPASGASARVFVGFDQQARDQYALREDLRVRFGEEVGRDSAAIVYLAEWLGGPLGPNASWVKQVARSYAKEEEDGVLHRGITASCGSSFDPVDDYATVIELSKQASEAAKAHASAVKITETVAKKDVADAEAKVKAAEAEVKRLEAQVDGASGEDLADAKEALGKAKGVLVTARNRLDAATEALNAARDANEDLRQKAEKAKKAQRAAECGFAVPVLKRTAQEAMVSRFEDKLAVGLPATAQVQRLVFGGELVGDYSAVEAYATGGIDTEKAAFGDYTLLGGLRFEYTGAEERNMLVARLGGGLDQGVSTRTVEVCEEVASTNSARTGESCEDVKVLEADPAVDQQLYVELGGQWYFPDQENNDLVPGLELSGQLTASGAGARVVPKFGGFLIQAKEKSKVRTGLFGTVDWNPLGGELSPGAFAVVGAGL